MMAKWIIALATLVGLGFADWRASAGDQKACASEIGQASADRLKEACRNVSPATHPPCGTSNSCALIKDEIARGCAFLGDTEAAKIEACGPAPTSAAAAVETLQRYYEAIDERDYETAYELLKFGNRPTQSLADFRKGFTETRTTRVEPGEPGAIEGAAGSAFVTVPVTVEALLDNGVRQRFAGSYVLRHVDAQGPTAPIDTRWFIYSSNLRAAR